MSSSRNALSSKASKGGERLWRAASTGLAAGPARTQEVRRHLGPGAAEVPSHASAADQSPRLPVVALVSHHVIRTGEQLDQDNARDEAPDMRPEGHAAPLLGEEPEQTAYELDRGPVEEHRPGWQRDRREEETEHQQREHTHPRVQDQIGAHDAADRARGA